MCVMCVLTYVADTLTVSKIDKDELQEFQMK